ncbi:MAG: nucleotide exchange factor GrpE [Candidatus Komeilibacteria bacterium RIFCSPLOWO2_01_FULL_52_15]|uniref:Protein GrpE n=2 Tax=Candidatus Komeiliibacteriota TaxID=1817908 RepID=A0A1G2BR09_9BACT|nr:MAG: nucleotide exchange factor GrpE [Candidatus Komeilibacteria bacterium RIFCSPHIGHO2_01_FULL_52_14]OGY91564.1 MAG: nucleotide exchange factor GrpE [Candidatus Komeilibacteria bacterium RIFCSPLOWO2_01_FULL_52_15]
MEPLQHDTAPAADKKSSHQASPPAKGTADVASLTSQRDEYLNGWKRALADYENFKRESIERLDTLTRTTLKMFLLDLLPFIDAYYTALSHVPESERSHQWYLGLLQAQKLWEQLAQRHAIRRMNSIGVQFDPARHHALATAQETGKKENEITGVAQEGYLIRDEVLRPALVTVNKIAPEAAPQK